MACVILQAAFTGFKAGGCTLLKVVKKSKLYEGQHNAFTDLLFGQQKFYLAFRNGANHLSYDGKILLTRSPDGKDWSQPQIIINTPTDDRDPKLYFFKEKLFCTIQTRWAEGAEHHRRLPMVSYTSDGKTWSTPAQCFEKDYVPWRPKETRGLLYNTFYRYHREDPALWQVVLAKSWDGLRWEYVSTIYQGDCANETELHFRKDGTMMAVVRRENKTSVLASAPFPYSKWNYQDLGFCVHAPCLKMVNGKLLLAGREYTPSGAGVSLWAFDGKSFVKELEIEEIAQQDCSYCGLEQLPDNCCLLSYYKGTGSDASIWLAILEDS